MKKIIKKIIEFTGYSVNKLSKKDLMKYDAIYQKYKDFTMMPKSVYLDTLAFSEKLNHITGNVVECGVWRGGMIAGLSAVLGKDRKYLLCDSFEGLPDATQQDGVAAIEWQQNKTGETYFNNCSADESFASQAMTLAQVEFELIKGWFDKTLPELNTGPIAFLRLDADWFDSTYCCLQYLYPKVVKNGIILIDDYFVWDGCSKAVHTYLAQTPSRIYHTQNGVTYIIKNE